MSADKCSVGIVPWLPTNPTECPELHNARDENMADDTRQYIVGNKASGGTFGVDAREGKGAAH